MTGDKIDDAKIAQVAGGWVEYQRTKSPLHAWAVDEKDIWFYEDESWSTMERFIRAACAAATNEETDVIGMIGASLLEDLIDAYPERAMAFLDGEVESSDVLAEALGYVRSSEGIRSRIEEILRRLE